MERLVTVKLRSGASFRKKVPTWTGLKNVDMLKRYISENYIRFEASECLDLPETIHKEVLVSKSPQAWLEAEFEKFDSSHSSVMPEHKKNAAMLKVKYTEKYVENLLDEGGSGPVIIYTDHVEPCLALAKYFKTTGIHGGTSVFDRYRLANEFKSGKASVLVATIGSFSTGISLIESNNLVFNDIAWVPGDLDQAIGRIVRVGQTKACVIHYLLGSPQDKQILTRVKEKTRVIREINKK
jgi:SNF2 family DNA or RNA helicase